MEKNVNSEYHRRESFQGKFPLRLTVIFCLVAVLTIGTGFGIIRHMVNSQIRDVLQLTMVSLADAVNRGIGELETILAFTALRPVTVRKALVERDSQTLLRALREVMDAGRMQVLTITDENGIVFIRAHNPVVSGDSIRDDVFVVRVLGENRPVSGISYESDSALHLHEEGKDYPPKRNILTIKAAVPVTGDRGALIGVLVGGVVLDHDLRMIDTLRNNVMLNDTYGGLHNGFAALFDRERCLAWSMNGGNRSWGPLNTAPENVHEIVVKAGRSCLEPIMVGNEVYRTLFEPLKDVNGIVVGMFSVGILEKKFIDARNRIMLLWFVISGIVLVSAFFITNWLMGGTIAPFKKQLADMSEQVAESYRLALLGQLAAGVAHEINNPLGGIMVYAHLLKEDTAPDDPRYANIEKIIKESNRCKTIVRSLLDFSRQDNPVLEKADVRMIIAEALNNIRREPVFGSIDAKECSDEMVPVIIADSSQIQEVCENIILNAAEVMCGKGELIITCRCIRDEGTGSMVELLFEDSGPGIALEHMGHIFDPFYTTKHKGHGTGLGLAVSYGIVHRHGGSISVRNRETGGAAFSVKLPVERTHGS